MLPGNIEYVRFIETLEAVLQSMSPMSLGPAKLVPRLRFELESRELTNNVDGAISLLFEELGAIDTRGTAHGQLAQFLRTCDAMEAPKWASETSRLSVERREHVYALLDLPFAVREALTVTAPIARDFEASTLIAAEHEEWYTTSRRQRTRSFYWDSYANYLKTSDWDLDSISTLHEATDKVVGSLADPERAEAYPTRGLVVGYVQSGKTANFTAVIAKAIDAGYRLIIVLAGTLDSLRFQTQRRLDKELVGRELIRRDAEAGQPHEYAGDTDWAKFNGYGAEPSHLGSFNIRRITTSVHDYRRLGQGRDVLRFTKLFADRRFNHPDNLHRSEAKLVVIKKNPAVITKFLRDLKGLQASLDDVPAIVIDDESDQASVNTVNPRSKAARKDRTATNASILDLLRALPRCQYIGYTATPAANTLINPDDAEDLFPKDFIELLPRPRNYMGVRDFHDFDDQLNPLDEDAVAELGQLSNRTAFVRKVTLGEGEDDKLKEALDAFFLSGAIKLYRADVLAGSVSTRHHTMLVHRAPDRDAHEEDAERVRHLLAENRYRTKAALQRLWKLWQADFAAVAEARAHGLPCPSTFDILRPYLEQALEKFERSRKQVLIVNGRDANRDDMPDFDKESVWNILVGGAKLSRGYTVEGLTTTYFVRKAGAADTLMQMGRWFGFRRGYGDLVRLYIGTNVGRTGSKTVDLYELFESICMDEERFRRRIAIYSRENIRPIQVPPLVPMGMLVPTGRNKMHNARIVMENYGGKVAESGRVSFEERDRVANARALAAIWRGVTPKLVTLGGKEEGRRIEFDCNLGTTMPSDFSAFLRAYKWGTKDSQFATVLPFLEGVGDESPQIDRWLVVLLSNGKSDAQWAFEGKNYGAFRRSVVSDRFKVFSESRHRIVCEHICGLKTLADPSSDLLALGAGRQATCLIYPTIEKNRKGGDVRDNEVVLGLSLLFPRNRIKQIANWTVRDSSPQAPAFLDAELFSNDETR